DDDAPRLRPPARLQDVEGAVNVRLDVGRRGDVRVGDADQGGEVVDDVAPLHQFADEEGVGNVAEADLQFVAERGRNVPEVALVGLAVVACQRADAMTRPQQGLDEVATDEAAGARDENGESGCLHVVGPEVPRTMTKGGAGSITPWVFAR